MSSTTTTVLTVSSSKASLPYDLATIIGTHCLMCLRARGAFTLALSGGSLPEFLSNLKAHFETLGIDPQFDRWHVLLADERCVPEDHDDSNMGAIRKTFLSQVAIPEHQIHGIATDLLEQEDSTNIIAAQYEATLRKALQHSSNLLDLALLGFGPDGHTCSLFPNHALLQEQVRWVAPITDSPKPPSNRITLTLPVLNEHTRHVIVCGAGASKAPILKQVFGSLESAVALSSPLRYFATLSNPPPFPCAMVRPTAQHEHCTLTWLVDEEAAAGLRSSL